MDTDRTAEPDARAEIVELCGRLKPWQHRVVQYFMCLLLERRVAPSPALDAEIERVEKASRMGREFSVPEMH